MKLVFTTLAVFVLYSQLAFSYEGPSPLRDVKIELSVSLSSSGIYKYDYKIINPSTNNGEIGSIDMFLNQDREKDVALSSDGFTQCPKHFKHASEYANKKYFMPPVGSEAPSGWSCGYGSLAGYSYGSFGWGSSEVNMIKPGKSLGGFVLTSYGIPAIRDVLIQPDIDLQRLPPEYYENVEKTVALENKVKWMGKTIGPKAPPKVFNAETAIKDLIALKEQALDLEWIKDSGFAKSLEAKLEAAAKKIESGDKKAAKNILQAFLSEVEAQKGKQLTMEAYTLLYFNGKYLIAQL